MFRVFPHTPHLVICFLVLLRVFFIFFYKNEFVVKSKGKVQIHLSDTLILPTLLFEPDSISSSRALEVSAVVVFAALNAN